MSISVKLPDGSAKELDDGATGLDRQNTKVLGMQLDPYWRSLGFVQTHVMAEELTEEAILEGLRMGRCYVAFGILGEVTGVDRNVNGRVEVWSEGKPLIYFQHKR